MKRLKILFVTKDFSQYLERNFHYMQLELPKYADLALDHRGGEVRAILRRAPFQPDFVLFNDMFHASYCPPVSGLHHLKLPWGMIMHDLHAKPEQRREFLRRFPSATIFVMYQQAFRERYPEFKGRLLWLPHFVEPTVFRDYRRRKNLNVLLMGATNPKVYPLRHKMKTALTGHPGFVLHHHPGYVNFQSDAQALVARGFALEVNRAKIFLTCDSIFHYPLRKYFEVLACNTLLLAPENTDLRALGFKSGVHYAAVTERDFLAKIHFYLHPNNETLRAKISRQGYEFVREKHTTSVRTLQLLQMINSIVG
ncbi:MAG: glycosyltransferase [Paenibacillus sp.]|uniref:glycosyltransferase n=1 Tax=Paenibacillus sp. TaxID=58172 RepID=UPI00290BB069|nr:glycosyltransferase [Paenibacillus sp.]MDU4696621.1 glycosyltransferase [Paenibacillus sp.]